ncbi:MAG: amidase [Hahellaceae bacterium]|nr:amidase [Hahellaceae bacterium]MCP5212325.1 amidase [Hahellaceae bacterium]
MTDWAYAGVKAITTAIQNQEVSSVEMLHYFQQRITTHNPKLNAVVAQNNTLAESIARQADKDIASGNIRGPLHGLPMTIKDTYEVVGFTATSGARRWQTHTPATNATAVQRLLDAGVVPMGKTNVPYMASDWQSYNRIYGKTNNPWDFSRTPGGSSGGAAAAVSSGMSVVELGSDIGGSIRTPAHYCGVFGHKPSSGLISLRGHLPGPPGTQSEPDLAVAGPLAQSTDDLALMLNALAAPDPMAARAWQLQLPECELKSLDQFRVLAVLEHPLCPIDSKLLQHYRDLITKLRAAGVKVVEGQPEPVPLDKVYPLFLSLLGGQFSASATPMQRRQVRVLAPIIKRFGRLLKAGPMMHHYFYGIIQSHAHWLDDNEARAKLLQATESVFTNYDVILTPIVPTTAIAHDTDSAFHQRRLLVNGQPRPYTDHFPWIAMATALGLPATSAPTGLIDNHLPCNIQIIGRAYGDRTTLRFSKLLEAITGGMPRPPQFA